MDLDYYLVLILALSSFFVDAKDSWEQCENRFEPEIEGQALVNHVFAVINSETDRLCLTMCRLNEDCVSFNKGPSEKTKGWLRCELSDSDRYINAEDLQVRQGFTYRGKKNQCLSSPCQAPKSVCVRTEYDYSKHKCVCPAGLEGDICQYDIDECAYRRWNTCKKNPGVKCVNTLGSFQCLCADGYDGDGVTCTKTVVAASWKKINNNTVCVGVKGDSYGEVIVPFDANVKQFKLVHLSGAVSWRNVPVSARNWGDIGTPSRLFVVVTDEKNDVIAPYPGYPIISPLYFTIDNITVSSPEFVFPTSDSPLPLKKGKQLRVWFTHDLYDYLEHNTYGQTCADLYIY